MVPSKLRCILFLQLSVLAAHVPLTWEPVGPVDLAPYLNDDELCYLQALAQLSSTIPKLLAPRFQNISTKCRPYSVVNGTLQESTSSTSGSKRTYCGIGRIMYQNCGYVRPFLDQGPNLTCSISLAERFSFWISRWTHMPAPRHGHTHAASLFRTTNVSGFQHIIMIGDSVSEQLNSALAHIARTRLPSAPSVAISKTKTYLPCGLTKVGVTARNPSLVFTANPKLCTADGQAGYIVKRISYQPPASVIIFHPFGVHIWNTRQDLNTSYGVALGIIMAARRASENRSLLLILESPAQHFVYDVASSGSIVSDLGNYSGVYMPGVDYFRQKMPGSCCRRTVNSELGNFRNLQLMKDLTSIDPDWKSYIGWIPFYDMSQLMYNAHVDITESGPDCTHFIWSSSFLELLWHNMEKEIVRLLHVLGKG
jgi:hypothetical protein